MFVFRFFKILYEAFRFINSTSSFLCLNIEDYRISLDLINKINKGF